MTDEEKIPTELPSKPKMEVITESFAHSGIRHDSKDHPSPRTETGEKKD